MSEYEDQENESSGKLPQAFVTMMAVSKLEQQCKERCQEVDKEAGVKAENEILMPLWRDLGDHGETYWESMQSCASFVRVRKSIDKELKKLDGPMRNRIIHALIQSLQVDITSYNQIDGIVDEIKKKHAELVGGGEDE